MHSGAMREGCARASIAAWRAWASASASVGGRLAHGGAIGGGLDAIVGSANGWREGENLIACPCGVGRMLVASI